MRFKKRAVLLTALAVTAISAATVTQPVSAIGIYPGGSSRESVDGFPLWTKLTATGATCTNPTTNAWTVNWSFSAMAGSPEFITSINSVSPPLGGELVAGNTKSQIPIPENLNYRSNTFKYTANYTGTVDITETVTFTNTIISNVQPSPSVGTDNTAVYKVSNPCIADTVAQTLAGSSVFVPLSPLRILDTRNPGGGGKFADSPQGETRQVQVLGVAGVPTTDVGAVVLNVTANDSTRGGFVTVWPGGAVPTASNVNVDGAGQTAPNLVTVPVGGNGKISIFTDSGAHMLVDVMGYYKTVTTSQSAGRYQAIPLQRFKDTRNTKDAPGANQSLNVKVAGQFGVPADATAAVLNLTVVNSTRGGFTTVYPGGTSRPITSNLNTGRDGETRANQAIIKLGSDGSVDVYSESGSEILVDVAGYFTPASAVVSRSGLFIPVATPGRVADTRDAASGKPGRGATTEVRVGTTSGVDVGFAGSAVLNVTAVNATSEGFVTVHQTGTERPNTSSLNLSQKGQTVPNHVTAPLGISGDIAVFTDQGAHVIVDVLGWYTA